jgi:hypothetical protein
MGDPGGEVVVPKRRHRWWQFSIATMLTAMTVAAIALGLWTSAARKQEQAAKTLREKGWRIVYHHEMHSAKPQPPGPDWLRESLGIDYVDYVEGVQFSSSDQCVHQ